MATIHRFQLSDVAEVVSFIRGSSTVDPGVESVEESAFRSFAEQACNRDGQDFKVVRRGQRIIGVLLAGRFEVLDHSRSIRAFRIFVSAGQTGTAERLFELVETQDPIGSVTCRTVIGSSRTTAKATLKARGYRVVQEIAVLRRESLPLCPAVLPRGFKLRDAIPSVDVEAVARLYNIANRRSFGFAPLTSDELNETLGLPGGRLLVI